MTVSDIALLEQRREDILDAACACFAEKGFTATTMAHIAKSVGMSVGNLYNYFSGKDEILNELSIQESHRRSEYARRCISGEISPEEMRSNLIEHIKERLNPSHARVTLEVFVESVHNDKVAAVVHKFDESVRSFLNEIYSRQGLSSEQIKSRVAKNMILMDGIMIRALADPDLDRDFIAQVVADQIIGK